MIYTIKYSLLPGFEKNGVLAPVLPVTFINGKHEVSSFALVDSGAEYGLVSTVIAEGVSAFKCILGRNDIFKRAKITFEGYKNQFQIAFRNLN